MEDFSVHTLIPPHFQNAKNGRKKSSKSFSDLLLMAAAGKRWDIQFLMFAQLSKLEVSKFF